MTEIEIECLAERIAYHLYKLLRPELETIEKAEIELDDAAHSMLIQTATTFDAVADQIRDSLK